MRVSCLCESAALTELWCWRTAPSCSASLPGRHRYRCCCCLAEFSEPHPPHPPKHVPPSSAQRTNRRCGLGQSAALFRPVGTQPTHTLEQKKQIQKSASICSLSPIICSFNDEHPLEKRGREENLFAFTYIYLEGAGVGTRGGLSH